MPKHLQDPRQRFNVKCHINPDPALLLSEDSPDSGFLALPDHATLKLSGHAIDRTLWETDSAHDAAGYPGKRPRMRSSQPFLLRCGQNGRKVRTGTSPELHDLMQNCRNTAASRKVADHNALSRLLARPAGDRPDRVCAYKTNTRRFWLISVPVCVKEDAQDGF
ncbi:MAG: hypothetical protein JWM59_2590 [Verrucomicrobiales bacterium]|nr:hypothetical protein [Verrucomicrobiales bacterium]